MNASWLAKAAELHAHRVPFVTVTVLAVRGSAPVEAGRRLLVTTSEAHGSIGGGRLEEQVLRAARKMLAEGTGAQIKSVVLGASLGQCCGGRLVLHYELVALAKPHVAIYGAGHVGNALMGLLAVMPYRALCIDQRSEWVTKLPRSDNLKARVEDDPAATIMDLPAASYCLIMTHSHALDLELASLLLARTDMALVGVIGSVSKGRRFRTRLVASDRKLENFTCPIGVQSGKHPAEVALAILSEVASRITAEGQPPALAREAEKLLAELVL